MKKFLTIILSLIITLTVFTGCGEKADWEKDGALKILTIGNSFSDDAVEYMWNIATSLGIKEVVVANLHISGASLERQLNNATTNSPSYEYRINSSGEWKQENRKKMLDVITGDAWDFISVQQASVDSGVADTFDSLDGLTEIIQQNAVDAKIVWHMTWAYQSNYDDAQFDVYNRNQNTMYQAIVETVQTKVLANQSIKAVIPSGTAIQNARTSVLGDTLTRDGLHLTKTGRYIAGLAYVQVLTGLDVSEVEFSPVDEDAKKICLESVKNAISNPYTLTNSLYI